jgi:predicted HTH transcriptional regulator
VRAEFETLYGGARSNVTKHHGYANVVLSPSMFDVDAPTKNFLQMSERTDESYKGQKDKHNVLYKNDINYSPIANSVTKKLDLGIKIARRNDVLNVIKNNGKASIKDVKIVLKDINEKTIQRELLSLVKEGVLKKEGEKRWSTYKIAS